MIKTIQKFFLPAKAEFSELEFKRVVLMINVALITTAFSIFYLISTIILEMPSVFKLMVICSISFFSLAWMIKWGSPRKLVGSIYVSTVLIASFGVIYYTDGLYSFDIPWLALGPVCAVLLTTGIRQWVWLIASMLIVLFFGVEEIIGVDFPMELAENDTPFMFIISSSGLILILFAIIKTLDKTSEESLQKVVTTNQQLAAEKKKSDDLVKMRDRFFSIISHDLRGPVNNFKGLTYVLKQDVQNKELDNIDFAVQEMEKSVENISVLLDNLLNWASQQEGQIPYNPEKIKVEKLMAVEVEIFDIMAAAKSIELKYDLKEDYILFVDINTSSTILRNLINNALKFTDVGGLITISAEQNGDFVDILVKDSGIGMTQEQLTSLFEIGKLSSTYGTGGEKGTGLGLQIVKDFTALNKGKISVESEVGNGTTFTISLPSFVGTESYSNEKITPLHDVKLSSS